jgi:hypothetical protein
MMSLVSATTSPRAALIHAALGASVVLAIALLPLRSSGLYAAALLGIWLAFAWLIRYAGLIGHQPASRMLRWIPLRFSGPIGRFGLRPRGDGRHVEVSVGSVIVAQVIARDDGDEIVLEPEAVADSELEAFGAALGQAIEMAAAADEDRPPERGVTGPGSWGIGQGRDRRA